MCQKTSGREKEMEKYQLTQPFRRYDFAHFGMVNIIIIFFINITNNIAIS